MYAEVYIPRRLVRRIIAEVAALIAYTLWHRFLGLLVSENGCYVIYALDRWKLPHLRLEAEATPGSIEQLNVRVQSFVESLL